MLGPVDKPRPDADASEKDEPDEAGGELLISGGDTPLLLERFCQHSRHKHRNEQLR